jgi:hypothetical protein
VTSRRALICLFLTIVVYGAFIGYYGADHRDPPKIIDLAGSLGLLVLTYVWYYVDAAERHYQRTGALGAAIILVSVLAVPYYLCRSRAKGEKGKALLRLAGFCLAALVIGSGATALGALLA